MKAHQRQPATEADSSLRVIELNSADTDYRWRNALSGLPHGLIYHHPIWQQVLEEAYGYQHITLGCEDVSGKLRGVLPLSYTRSLLGGRRFSSLPRTPIAGPLTDDAQVTTALVHAAVEQVRAKHASGLQLKTLTNELDGLVDGVIGGPWRATYILALPEQPALLHFGNSRNHAQIKRAVNKATKLGVHIHPAETESELRAWYELYLETMRWVFVPPRPYHFFEVAWKRLHPLGMMRLLLAKHYQEGGSQLIGGLFLLMFGQTVFYAFSGWRREDQALRPNNALHWQAIQDACADGFRYYDFGEVSKNNPGLAEFKSKWGAEQKWLYRYYYPTARESEISMLDSTSRTRQFASAIWRRLPLKATELLGDVAHKLF